MIKSDKKKKKNVIEVNSSKRFKLTLHYVAFIIYTYEYLDNIFMYYRYYLNAYLYTFFSGKGSLGIRYTILSGVFFMSYSTECSYYIFFHFDNIQSPTSDL